MMDLQQVTEFQTALSRPPGENLARRLMADPTYALQPRDVDVAKSHVRWLEETLIPEARATLAEEKRKAESGINQSPPRQWAAMRERWERDEGQRLRARVEDLTRQRDALKMALAAYEKAEAEKRLRELQGLADSIPRQVQALQETIETKADLVAAVLNLAEFISDKFENEMKPLLNIPVKLADLRAQAAFLRDSGFEMREISEVKVPEGLRGAVERILGHEVELPRGSRRWRQIAAQQRTRALDEAALQKAQAR